MITLPRTATLSRGRLRAFWLAVWLLAGLAGGSLAGLVGGARRGGAVGAAVFAAGAAPGLARPGLARWPYRGWNFGARRVAGLATVYTTWVAHTTAVTPLDPEAIDAARGAPLDRATRWSPRATQPAVSYPSPSADPAHRDGQRAPLRVAYRWARDTHRPRGRWLVVCLAVLRWLQPPADTDERASVPADTYTLY